MGFFDDVTSIVHELRAVGEEIETFKDEAFGTVHDFVSDATSVVEQTGQDIKDLIGKDST